jgi:hypothetical protein
VKRDAALISKLTRSSQATWLNDRRITGEFDRPAARYNTRVKRLPPWLFHGLMAIVACIVILRAAEVRVQVSRGELRFSRTIRDYDLRAGAAGKTVGIWEANRWRFRRWGFSIASDDQWGAYWGPTGEEPNTRLVIGHAQQISISVWWIACPLTLLPAIWLIAHPQMLPFRRKVSPGFCSVCGYDLRATPDRCPECGTIQHQKKNKESISN